MNTSKLQLFSFLRLHEAVNSFVFLPICNKETLEFKLTESN